MSRVVKNIIVWVLALAVILCIVFVFTFGLSSVRSAGVSFALSDDDAAVNTSSLINGGVVRPNLLEYSTLTDLSTNDRLIFAPRDEVPFENIYYNNYMYTQEEVTPELVNGLWQFKSSNIVTEWYYLYYLNGADIADLKFTFSVYGRITGTSESIASFDFGLGVGSVEFGSPVDQDFTYQSFDLSGYEVGDHVIFSASFNYPDVEALCSFGLYFYSTQRNSYLPVTPIWFKLECYSLDDEAGFTGYVPYEKDYYDGYDEGYDEGYNAGVTDGTQSGYDDGYADGYDEGYNNGLADEVYTASQAFKSSGYNYVSVLSAGTSTKFEAVKKIGALVDGYENVNVPLSGLFFGANSLIPDPMGGLVLPADYESLTGDTVYELYASSQYAMSFNNYVEMAQWLIDNPMDNLVLIPSNINNPSSDGIYPIYFVMNDRSLLDRFVSGAGAAYDLGYQGGYSEGYDAGDGAGYDRGYGVGFNDGQVDAASGSYTFLGLIGSVIDAPISAFRGLLDFELLGVNMSSFVLAIMSLCVIIVIIRMVLR